VGRLTDCEHCLHRFEVEPGLRGALVNCPDCGRATRAAGDGDPLWTGLKLLSALGVVALTVVVGLAQGLPAGLLAGAAGAVLLWLLSLAA
jgi:hypothetical protein